MKFSVHVTRGSVLLRQQCNTLRTSGFMDDVMFYITAQIQMQALNVRYSPRLSRWIPGAKSVMIGCLVTNPEKNTQNARPEHMHKN